MELAVDPHWQDDASVLQEENGIAHDLRTLRSAVGVGDSEKERPRTAAASERAHAPYMRLGLHAGRVVPHWHCTACGCAPCQMRLANLKSPQRPLDPPLVRAGLRLGESSRR